MSYRTELPATVLGLLERLYDVPVGCDLADYLITDRELARELHADPNAREVNEKLLVAENGAHMDVCLYLDSAVLARLRTLDPLVNLHHRNLSDFCLVVEGISHFLCLAWNARHDKSVTLLELEMQAEVDKFLAALHMLDIQGNSDVFDEVHRHLFEYARFDDKLDAENRERYRRASHYAGKYCKTLRRFVHRVRRPGMLSELRRFYRLPQSAKINHIDTSFCATGGLSQ